MRACVHECVCVFVCVRKLADKIERERFPRYQPGWIRKSAIILIVISQIVLNWSVLKIVQSALLFKLRSPYNSTLKSWDTVSLTGPRSTVGNVSGNRCESDC